MQVTDEMLAAAMKSAVATGLVPKHLESDDYLKTWEAMKHALQAALDADSTLVAMFRFSPVPGEAAVIPPK